MSGLEPAAAGDLTNKRFAAQGLDLEANLVDRAEADLNVKVDHGRGKAILQRQSIRGGHLCAQIWHGVHHLQCTNTV